MFALLSCLSCLSCLFANAKNNAESAADKEVGIRRGEGVEGVEGVKGMEGVNSSQRELRTLRVCVLSIMLFRAFLCVLVGCLWALTYADVVSNFSDEPECLKFFYKGKVPQWGSETPGVTRLCQRFLNRFHFATLYDTHHRIAIYSAYNFEPSSGGGRETRWFVEPQVRPGP